MLTLKYRTLNFLASSRDQSVTLQAARLNITIKRFAATSIYSSLFSLALPSGQQKVTCHPNNPTLPSLAS